MIKGDKEVKIGFITAIEALKAMENIANDKNSYIHNRMTDDVGIFISAIEDLKQAIKDNS